MSKGKDIAEIRRRLFGGSAMGGAFYATVTAVDNKGARTCTVEADDIPYDDVLLYAVADDSKKGFCFIPTVGSTVLVARLGGSNELYVAMFSEVDKALLTIGENVTATMDDKTLHYKNETTKLTIIGSKVELTSDEIEFNGGKYDGLVKIKELTDSLNSLKAFVDAMHAALPTTFTAVGISTAANGHKAAADYTASMAGRSIVISKMENTKITHG